MKKKSILAIVANLILKLKKRKCLIRLRLNKEKIGETIQTIKFSNKLIRKFAKRIEKSINKIKEKEDIIHCSQDQLKVISKKSL